MNQILQRFLPLRLRMQKFLFLLEKRAVAPLHPQQPVRIDPAEFRHLRGNIFQKIAIVTDHHTSESDLLQHFFEPLNAGEVQMIRRFIEQQNVRTLHQRLNNRQPLLPASGERGRFRVQVCKASSSQRLGKTRATL